MVTLGRPLAASALLVGLMGGAAFGLFATIANLSTAVGERDAKAELLASLSARRPALTVLPAAGRLTFAADSGTQAAASFDAMVRATVLDAGGTVLSSRAETKGERSAAGNRMEVEAVVEGRIEALQKILYRFEYGTPVVFVDNLSLRPAEVSGTASKDPRAPVLHETLLLSGYWERTPR